MDVAAQSRFELFSQEFVRKYWETVKSDVFPMAPDEPVEETVEELLSVISHETEFRSASSHGGPLYMLRMMNTLGDWWLFTFRDINGTWDLVGASVRSYDKMPDDLLGPVYSQSFEPFLRHVTEAASDTMSI